MNKNKAVLVTTEFKGVFFGYLAGKASAEAVVLLRARNCIYWPAANKGFLGLATEGPLQEAKIGPRVDEIQLFKITSVARVTSVAAETWENFPCKF